MATVLAWIVGATVAVSTMGWTGNVLASALAGAAAYALTRGPVARDLGLTEQETPR